MIFPMLMAAGAGIAIWKIIVSSGVSQWWGVLGVALSFIVFFSYLMTARMGRTSANLPWLLSIATVSWLASGVLAIMGSFRVAPFVFASVLLICIYLYVFWYSRLHVPTNKLLTAGKNLPEFLVEDAEGKTVSSSDLAGKPTIFLFFRGNWCPLCMAQVKELSAQYREVADRGAEVVLISPQPHANTRALAARFDAPMLFLVDPKARAARQLGLVHEAGLPMGMQALGYDTDTVLPTAVITDASQRILWVHQTDNYRVRPEPGTFLKVLDEAQALG